MSSDQGCQWVVGKVKRWNSTRKANDTIQIHCLKLVAEGSVFCPKHKLVAQELNQEQHPTGVYAYEPKEG
jgi:hypothetical protein